MALNMIAVTTKDPGRGVWGRGQSAPQRGIFKGAGAPLNGLFPSFLPEEKMGPAGVWGRGLSRPQRRDLRGPIK